MESWQEFAWQEDELDPRRDRLCADDGESFRLDCALEGADFRQEPAEPKDEIVVCAYNVERGLKLRGQLRAFEREGEVPLPDVLLLSEADRGCSRTDGVNVAREFARALGMCYVYGVEFIELPRLLPGRPMFSRCEHGNAIVSRYPLGNVRLIRHEHARNWDVWWQRRFFVGEPRLGGRIALAADVRIGARLLHVYAVHFESGHRGEGPTSPRGYRQAQAREVIEDAAEVTDGVVIGGDMNVGRFLNLRGEDDAWEPVTGALTEAGYADAHSSLEPKNRETMKSRLAIDLIFGRGVTFTEAGIGPAAIWDRLSDHRPAWARLMMRR